MRLHLITLTILAGCTPSIIAPIPTQYHGVWKTDGYGYVLDIEAYRIRQFDVTENTCRKIEDINFGAGLFLTKFDVTPSANGQQLTIRETEETHAVLANRLAALPSECALARPTTPLLVFDSFAETMAEHYAFFDLHKVVWSSRVALARPQISQETTDANLFEIFSKMLNGLDDGHLMLTDQTGNNVKFYSPSQNSVSDTFEAAVEAGQIGSDFDFIDHFWTTGIGKTLLVRDGHTTAFDTIQYGVLGASTGYVAIKSMYGYAGDGLENLDGDLAATDVAMDEILRHFEQQDVQSIVIDVSFNNGGYDAVSNRIAARFAAEPTHGYSKFAADADQPIATQIIIHPSDGRRFEGPVFLVTSELTNSAAEVFTLAMQAFANVTIVGGRTNGAFSNVLEKTLPNGWKLSLSNEVYLNANGTAVEGVGVQPDAFVDIFPPNNLLYGHLRVINSLVAQLENG